MDNLFLLFLLFLIVWLFSRLGRLKPARSVRAKVAPKRRTRVPLQAVPSQPAVHPAFTAPTPDWDHYKVPAYRRRWQPLSVEPPAVIPACEPVAFKAAEDGADAIAQWLKERGA